MKFGSNLSPSGRHTLVTTTIGIRVCVSILDRLEGPLDLPELEDETKVFELG
jgi:ataxin-10